MRRQRPGSRFRADAATRRCSWVRQTPPPERSRGSRCRTPRATKATTEPRKVKRARTPRALFVYPTFNLAGWDGCSPALIPEYESVGQVARVDVAVAPHAARREPAVPLEPAAE